MANFKTLKVGDILTENQRYKVDKIVGNRTQLSSDNGGTIIVENVYVEKYLSSASDFTETKKVTKTELAEIFLTNTSVAMTVNYFKQVKEADVLKEVMDKISDAKVSEIEKAVKAGLKKAISGEERTLAGVHYGATDDFGRTHMIDMNLVKEEGKTYDTRQRLVDSRTLNFVICRGVKYTVK